MQHLPRGCYVSADIEVQRLWDEQIRQVFERERSAMVVLLSILRIDGTSWKTEDIAKRFLSHYLNHPDQIFDYDALARTPDPERFRLSSVISHLKKMPLDKLSNAPEDCFILDSSQNVFRLKPEYEPFWQQEAFRNLVQDRAAFLLARYFLKARLQQAVYYRPSILTEDFTVKRHFVDQLFGQKPPDSTDSTA